ncbi:hypothetical protein SAMN06272735_9299 [Streptomyces sp. TLI_55]|nr:hypothetical protein SAMN06272735_9299 [Streptomyces sp. TLI_55]
MATAQLAFNLSGFGPSTRGTSAIRSQTGRSQLRLPRIYAALWNREQQ